MNMYAPKPGEQVRYHDRQTGRWVRATVLYQCGNDDALALATDSGTHSFVIHGVSPGSWSTSDEVIRWMIAPDPLPALRAELVAAKERRKNHG